MTVSEKNSIEKLIVKESKKIQKNQPIIEDIDFSYEKLPRGRLLARLSTSLKKKKIVLKEEGHCSESTVKAVFKRMLKILNKNKHKTTRRFRLKREVSYDY
jgi:hypothetical protein